MSLKFSKTIKFLSLEFCFLFAMWLSKTAWPLWFSQNGDLKVYGLSYSVMALTGVFSIGFSSVISRIGIRKSILIGLLLYGTGIGLRWYNQSLAAGISSGFFGGVGASLVLLSMRLRARLFQGDDISPNFIAARKATGDAAAGLAGLVIAGLIAYFGFCFAVFSALVPLGIAILLAIRSSEFHANVPANSHSSPRSKDLWANPRLRRLLILSFIGGLYSSLSLPYLPILYREIGLPADKIPLLATLATVVSLVVGPLSIWATRKRGPLTAFVLGEGLYLASMAALLVTHSERMVPVLVVVRVFGRSVSGLAEEMIELAAVSKNHAAAFYGTVQTTFLLGDSIGGGLGGIVVAEGGLRMPFLIAIALILIHVTGMLFGFRTAGARIAELGHA